MTGGSSGVEGFQVDQKAKREIVELILLAKEFDVEYARFIFKRENARQPWLGLADAVREAMK